MQLLELIQNNTTALYAVVLVLGLLVGSFLNVVIYRLPVMLVNQWRRDSQEMLELPVDSPKKFNLMWPASRCGQCEAPIKSWQNIPLFSYLFLRGRCANCQQSISLRYPAIELTTGLLSLLLAVKFGATLPLIAMLVLLWCLIALTMIDVDHQLLPDAITLPLMWLGLLLNIDGMFVDLPSAVLGAVGGYMSLWSVFWLFKLATGKEGMGFGDFKLLAVFGAWFGWQSLFLIIMLSSVVGAMVGVLGIMVLGRDKQLPIPFGPYLAVAGMIAALYGAEISQWYLTLVMP